MHAGAYPASERARSIASTRRVSRARSPDPSPHRLIPSTLFFLPSAPPADVSSSPISDSDAVVALFLLDDQGQRPEHLTGEADPAAEFVRVFADDATSNPSLEAKLQELCTFLLAFEERGEVFGRRSDRKIFEALAARLSAAPRELEGAPAAPKEKEKEKEKDAAAGGVAGGRGSRRSTRGGTAGPSTLLSPPAA